MEKISFEQIEAQRKEILDTRQYLAGLESKFKFDEVAYLNQVVNSTEGKMNLLKRNLTSLYDKQNEYLDKMQYVHHLNQYSDTCYFTEGMFEIVSPVVLEFIDKIHVTKNPQAKIRKDTLELIVEHQSDFGLRIGMFGMFCDKDPNFLIIQTIQYQLNLHLTNPPWSTMAEVDDRSKELIQQEFRKFFEHSFMRYDRMVLMNVSCKRDKNSQINGNSFGLFIQYGVFNTPS